jgi:hypothetical protein
VTSGLVSISEQNVMSVAPQSPGSCGDAPANGVGSAHQNEAKALLV